MRPARLTASFRELTASFCDLTAAFSGLTAAVHLTAALTLTGLA